MWWRRRVYQHQVYDPHIRVAPSQLVLSSVDPIYRYDICLSVRLSVCVSVRTCGSLYGRDFGPEMWRSCVDCSHTAELFVRSACSEIFVFDRHRRVSKISADYGENGWRELFFSAPRCEGVKTRDGSGSELMT